MIITILNASLFLAFVYIGQRLSFGVSSFELFFRSAAPLGCMGFLSTDLVVALSS